MAYTTIDKPEDYFNTVLYTGDGSADQSMTGVGFKPDFLWIKRRNAAERHVLTNAQYDVSDGAYKWQDSSANNAQFSGGTGVASFDADGFTIKSSDSTWNTSGSTYVFWSWKMNGGTTSTNTDGDIDSTVQVNQAAGQSIISYTPTNTTTRNIGHGLGVKPDCIIIRNKTRVENWRVWFNVIGQGAIMLDSTGTYTVNSNLVNSATSSTFNVGGDFSVNGNYPYIAYAFAEKQGYSKFGKYVGSGNGANGPFVYTGFKPAFVMIKVTDAVEGWVMFDNKRKDFNQDAAVNSLYANTSQAEYTGASYHNVDLLSNGFKVLLTNVAINQSGASYVYMAFAENPFTTSTGVPTTAR
jgi:hypothetical protein